MSLASMALKCHRVLELHRLRENSLRIVFLALSAKFVFGDRSFFICARNNDNSVCVCVCVLVLHCNAVVKQRNLESPLLRNLVVIADRSNKFSFVLNVHVVDRALGH